MPRPKKENDERRIKRMEVRLTIGEDQSIKNFAEEAGLCQSDFVRKAALGSKPRVQKAVPERAILIKGVAELGKIGSNVNQIAKALNTGLAKRQQATVPAALITSALTDVQMLSGHLIKTLENGHNGQ